jgi:hypothetical protein
VEQLVEDYLATDPVRGLHRPMALVLTKSDVLDPSADLEELAVDCYGMTEHALKTHFPHSGLFAVSSLGGPLPVDGLAAGFAPRGLASPLAWLALALQDHDEARLEWIFAQAPDDLALLQRCVACFARRYPDAPATATFRQRIRERLQRRRRNRVFAAVAGAAVAVLGLWSYDALGHHQVARYEAANSNSPAAVLRRWEEFQTWHPTRHLTRPISAEAEERHLRSLGEQARRQACDERLTELRRRAADPDADPEESWRHFQEFRLDYPEVDVAGDLEQLRATMKSRRDEQLARRAQQAYDELRGGEQRAADLPARIAQAERFLREFAGTPHEADVRRRLGAYLARHEERDLEAAHAYSRGYPFNFQTRILHYQRYLDRHPGGAHAKAAQQAIKTIEAEWDRYDFSLVRDHFVAHPGDTAELTARCRAYLGVHPQGRFVGSATELLRWCERVTAPAEYRLVAVRGNFDPGVARFFSRGPDLSIEVEVAGVRYGPSHIVVNRYDPDWYYEFSRPIRWKQGDSVVVRVRDHDWKDRVVYEVFSGDGDPLAIRLLSGELQSGPHAVTFECDFAMPVLPGIE